MKYFDSSRRTYSLSQLWIFSSFRHVDKFSHKAPSEGSMFPMRGPYMTHEHVSNDNYSSNNHYQINFSSLTTYRRRITSLKRKNLSFVKNHGTWQQYCHTKVKFMVFMTTYPMNSSCPVKRP